MEHFTSLAIPAYWTLIKWWFRYVGDVHSASKTDQVNKLQEHLNSIDPHIKFIIELSETDGFPFLVILTKPSPNSIQSTVYSKPTHTDRRLDYSFNLCQIFKMASSSLKENGVPNEIVVRNVVLHNIFPMMVRSVMLWVLRFARTL